MFVSQRAVWSFIGSSHIISSRFGTGELSINRDYSLNISQRTPVYVSFTIVIVNSTAGLNHNDPVTRRGIRTPAVTRKSPNNRIASEQRIYVFDNYYQTKLNHYFLFEVLYHRVVSWLIVPWALKKTQLWMSNKRSNRSLIQLGLVFR